MLRYHPVVALAFAALAVAPVASIAAGGLTPRELLALRSVGSAIVSPGGTHVAFTLNVPRDPLQEDDGPDRVELHVIGPDGLARPFITGEGGIGSPAWSPDGSLITFLAKRDGDSTKALYAIPVDGGEARRLRTHATDIESYAWSPDGRRIVFTAGPPDDEAAEARARRGFNQEVFEEGSRGPEAWIVDARRPDAVAERLELEGFPSLLAFSPDGARLAFASAPSPRIDDAYMRRRVRVAEAATGRTIARFENPGKLESLAWSPDGERLAVVGTSDVHDPAAGRILVGSMARQDLREAFPGFAGHCREVRWKDAKTLLFVADEGVGTWIGEATWPPERDEVGTPEEEAAVGPPRVVARRVGLALGALTLSADGRTGAVAASSALHPAEAFRLDTATGELVRLTASNPALESVRLAPQEIVSWRARDGLELEGILIRPLDEEPGRRYPLILMVHGGPESHYRDGWLSSYAYPGQVAAARGFAVFYPNYRASTGRGVAFSMLDHGDFAGREFDDLVDAVDHLVAEGLVDRDRVGVTGRSYGGYATAWCATALSDRFAAAVMGVGISDQLSFFGTTEIPDEMVLVHYRKRPWEDWNLFLERSPIRHVETARTPLLILHGKDDSRVHPSQSMELYRYLKEYGRAPVRLVLYPGEGHGVTRAAGRLDTALRLLQWMEHYLMGPGGDPPPGVPDHDASE